MVLVQVLLSDSRSGCAQASPVEQMSHLYYLVLINNIQFYFQGVLTMGSTRIWRNTWFNSDLTVMSPNQSQLPHNRMQKFMRVYKKMLVCNAAIISATKQTFKPHPSQSWTWACIPTPAWALTFPGFHQDCHRPVVVQLMSWNSRRSSSGFCTKAWILKSAHFKLALVCRYVRLLLRVDFLQSQLWNSEAKKQQQTVNLVAQSHKIPILNTCMAD